MNKLMLFFLFFLMVGLLMACTSSNIDKSEKTLEDSQKEGNEVKEVDYKIPDDGWDLSLIFDHSIVYDDGNEHIYTFVGNKETLGFIGPLPIVAGNLGKHLWFYFGEENVLNKPVIVKGIKQGTDELIDLHSGSFYEGARVSADSVNMPSNMKFPSAGLWKVLVYIDGQFYDSIVIEVEY
ncbi:hypothetical protein [Chengkuizengella axinellae]|uniref:DUF4871 domain-containing protein n=1 Tax=Chengkuizengella axinellae TaxID=3064388 RepID=A0ABT9J6N8_9BACL|nr:hypothetical protein [Chengkuizengella sp. 2205SS18-9]MDP5277218.1 hypothetical protein [Chengkuizengella sp. 2205SS18-9]